MRKLMVLSVVLLAFVLNANAQSSAIIGMVVDDQSEAVIGADVQLHQETILKQQTITDKNGDYRIKKLEPGRYDLRISYNGFKTSVTTGIIVSPDRVVQINVMLTPASIADTTEFKSYTLPIDTLDRSGITILTAEEIPKIKCYAAPPKSKIGPCAIEAGTFYYVDGVRVRPGTTIPVKKPFWQRLKFWKLL